MKTSLTIFKRQDSQILLHPYGGIIGLVWLLFLSFSIFKNLSDLMIKYLFFINNNIFSTKANIPPLPPTVGEGGGM